MALDSHYQMDFLENFTHENRLISIEQKQESLRKGLFKRWKEQEEKIKHLHNEIQILTGILEGIVLDE